MNGTDGRPGWRFGGLRRSGAAGAGAMLVVGISFAAVAASSAHPCGAVSSPTTVVSSPSTVVSPPTTLASSPTTMRLSSPVTLTSPVTSALTPVVLRPCFAGLPSLKPALSGVLGADAWGNNASGELDDGTNVNRKLPVVSVGLAGISAMSVGAVHSLALRADGTVVSWGHNKSGELGNGTVADSWAPVVVKGLSSVRSVAAGTSFSLAVRSDGAVFGWGNNQSGELGDGSATNRSTPVPVVGLGSGSGVIAVAAGGAFSLALKADGTVLAWGNNASGELGDGTAPNDHLTPVPVVGLGAGSGVVQLAAGASSGLALRSNGAVLGWGNNQSGEVGDGTTTDRSAPVPVLSLGSGSGVRKVVAGGAFSLALRSNGTVSAWGNNATGELGDGTAPTDHATPVSVAGVSSAVDIAAGRGHGLALLSNGTVMAWGDNNLGQLGDGTNTQHHTPVKVTTPHGLAVFAGGDHSHAVLGTASSGSGGGNGGSSGGSGGGGSGGGSGAQIPLSGPARTGRGNPSVTG